MDELSLQLSQLNELASGLYNFVEQGKIRLTRRRLLVLQTLLFVDTNTNATFRLLSNEPRYIDSAEMILRSMYDLTVSVDWTLKEHSNARLWRWLRDDRKTLHTRLDDILELKNTNPRLNTKQDPIQPWIDAHTKVSKELRETSRKAGVKPSTREESLLGKVRDFGPKSQLQYHTLFWLFSTKTHASASGLQSLLTINPLRLTRRTDPLSTSDELHAEMLMRTAIRWYSNHIYRTSCYLNTPQKDDARRFKNK